MFEQRNIPDILRRAIAFRTSLECIEPEHDNAFRLLNGFTEDFPELVIDIFARTAVLQNYAGQSIPENVLDCITDVLRTDFPWLTGILLKQRGAATPEERNGLLLPGSASPDTFIREHGIRYALNLTMNQDCSFYPDTRFLRKYLLENAKGKQVLNTFAYTGSLGIAALAGDAEKVTQSDLSGRFLTTAENSCRLNGFPEEKMESVIGDFFPVTSLLRRNQREFDIVILDPPFYSRTPKGIIDLAHAPVQPISKVQPLVRDGGVLIVVNNALQLSGADFMTTIERICVTQYLSVEQIIPIPDDFRGPNPSWLNSPDPFNHPTKIVVFRVHRTHR